MEGNDNVLITDNITINCESKIQSIVIMVVFFIAFNLEHEKSTEATMEVLEFLIGARKKSKLLTVKSILPILPPVN